MSRVMKDSGITWIGEIPEGWNCARMKQIGKYVNGYAFKPEDWGNSGKPIIRIQDLTGSNNSPNYYEGDIDEKYLIKNGDILVSWAATLDAFIWGNGEGWLNQHIFKAIPNTSIQKDFFFWLLKVAMSHMNNDNKHGIVMQHLTLNVFGNFIIPIPSLAEQQRIAEFLDRKCAEVDEMIGLQEQIIEELKAYKQSVITKAVTKGLNPAAPMRDSGIEWIGQIPEHWSKDKIIRSFRMIGSGTTPKSTDENNFDGDINWIQSGDINGGVMESCKNRVSNETIENCSALKVYSAPFIIVAMYGASVGNTSISSIDGCVNQACCVLSDSALNFNYAFSIIKSCKDYWLRKAVGGGQPNISQETIKQTWIPIPPITEQQAIADYLDEKCADIDALIATKQQKIDSLKEYKKSIIYEYVTGKREVEL